MMVGIGFRQELSGWLEAQPCGVDCLEITAEHFFGERAAALIELSARYPLFVHGLGLSLGTPGPLDRGRLAQFARVVAAANPRWISEHVAFSRTTEADLGHLNPLPLTREAMEIVAAHAREVEERCEKPILLENIASHLAMPGEMTEPEFLNGVCAQAGCGLLLDVTNLYINSRNHGFDPLVWLRAIEPGLIRQLHLVGYSNQGDRLTDAHARPIQEELIALAEAVVRVGRVEAVVLERDEDIPEAAELEVEIGKLERIAGRH